MDNIFILNPSVTTLNLKNAIDERLLKAKAIAACLLSQDYAHHKPNNSSILGAIWAIDEYLDEIEYLGNRLNKMKN